MKYLIGISLIAVLAGVWMVQKPEISPPVDVTQTQNEMDVAVPASVVADPKAPRASYGNLLTQENDDSQIVPWDRTAIQNWLEKEIAEVAASVTDPDIQARAADNALWEDGNEGFIFARTDSAVDLIYSNDAQSQQHGYYLLLVSAAQGDPRAIFGVSDTLTYLPAATSEETKMARLLERAAADRGYLPSITNFVASARKNEEIPTDVVEAYIDFGLQLKARPGATQLATQTLEHYVFGRGHVDHKDQITTALTRLQESGWEYEYHIYFAEMAYEGRHMTQDYRAALESYEWLAKQGHIHSMMRAGYIYDVGKTGPSDYDSAKAFYVAAAIENEGSAFRNLGILAEYGDSMPQNRSLASALYAHAMKLAEEAGSDSLLTRARRSQLEILDEMSTTEKLAVSEYREMLEAGKIAEISALGTIRDIYE